MRGTFEKVPLTPQNFWGLGRKKNTTGIYLVLILCFVKRGFFVLRIEIYFAKKRILLGPSRTSAPPDLWGFCVLRIEINFAKMMVLSRLA